MPLHRHVAEIDQELALLGAPVTATFTPHLLPLDQGELVSCYVTPARPTDQDELAGLYADAYVGEPFVELTDRPPGVRDVRDTNICRISVHEDPRTGKLIVFGAIDNLWKGAASQAVQNLNLMLGLGRGGGDHVTFFDSRWIDRPDHVRRAPGRPAAGLPRRRGPGGIKPSGKPDVGLLVCDRADATSAARFTRSGVLAAPVLLTQERCRLEGLRAVVANSGNANAATGRRGLDAAAKMQGAAAVAGGRRGRARGVASTGVIGVQLDADAIVRALPDVHAELADGGDAAFTEGIWTTDAFESARRCRSSSAAGRCGSRPRPRARA